MRIDSGDVITSIARIVPEEEAEKVPEAVAPVAPQPGAKAPEQVKPEEKDKAIENTAPVEKPDLEKKVKTKAKNSNKK